MLKEVLLNQSSKWLNENQLILSKQECGSMTELLMMVKEEFDSLLLANIVGYQQIRQ